jgi:hypothetical protein
VAAVVGAPRPLITFALRDLNSLRSVQILYQCGSARAKAQGWLCRANSGPQHRGCCGGGCSKQTHVHDASDQTVPERIELVVIGKSLVRITFTSEDQADGSSAETLEIPWDPTKASRTHLPPPSDGKPDHKLLQAVVRAHAWLADLESGRFGSIEELAEGVELHPKVVRQAFMMALLAPSPSSAGSASRVRLGAPCGGAGSN